MPAHHLLLRLAVACCAGFLACQSSDAGDFQQDILPILQTHCFRCHGADVQEGNLRLDTLSPDLANDRVATETWHDVLHVLYTSQMPPEGAETLSNEQRETLTNWLSVSIRQTLDARRSTDGRVVMRRLNRIEYQNTMRDLLGLDMDYVRDLPPDAVSSDGFQNDGRSLQMSPLQFEYYLATARRALDRVIVQGDAPRAFDHAFSESKIDTWLGNAQRSNRLGRRQEFLAKMVDDYPDDGEFCIRVQLTASLPPNTGFPLLEVSVGYQPDTEILLREFDLIEITTPDRQSHEFRGRLENFPLPVRGQGKFPGLVIRVRNVYDDKSPLPDPQKDANESVFYAEEPHLPTVTIESVEFHGNAYKDWPPSSHRSLLLESPQAKWENSDYVADMLKRFMTRAFRRPVEDSEVTKMVEFYSSARKEFPTFEESIRETIAMVLIQPDFLYLIEPAGDQKRPITEWELASRLSYFLWSTMPDAELMKLAAEGSLRANLATEVDRMLSDARSQRFVAQFTDQWLGLSVVDNVAVDRGRFPDFDDQLKQHMLGETKAVFNELLKTNSSAVQMLDSEFTMLNEPLARHYGIAGVFGRSFRRVALQPDDHRGGLLSHASILLSNSTGADSHPVRRAVWIRDRLLNDPPAPPPPNVPTLAEANPEFRQLSVREQLEIHRTVESCNSCHRSIDVWGIALENYDAVGKWRTHTQKMSGDQAELQPINATVVLPSGQDIFGAKGLKEHLARERTPEVMRSFVSRLLTYALGRSLELSDQVAIDQIVEKSVADEYRMKDLIHKAVLSEPFQTK